MRRSVWSAQSQERVVSERRVLIAGRSRLDSLHSQILGSDRSTDLYNLCAAILCTALYCTVHCTGTTKMLSRGGRCAAANDRCVASLRVE